MIILLLISFFITPLLGKTDDASSDLAVHNAQAFASLLRDSAQSALQKKSVPVNQAPAETMTLEPLDATITPADQPTGEVTTTPTGLPSDIVLSLPPIDDLDEPSIELHFENADLQNVADYIAELLHINFLTDDAVKPMMQAGRGVIGNKISFKSHTPMTKREIFTLFNTFLDVAGLALTATPNRSIYRIMVSVAANKAPLPALIDVDPDIIPNDDLKIRYVRFLKNASLDTIQPIVESLRSSTSSISFFSPLKAFIITDKAYNIKTLINIINELDEASMPETMSVIKLKRANADEVKRLFDELMRPEDTRGLVAKVFGKKSADVTLLPEGTRFVAEPRNNYLIVFGNKDTIKKIEDFIATKIDVELLIPDSPFYIYELQHNDAVSMAEILNKVTQYGIGTPVGNAGGIRDGQKYFKSITFTPEVSGNRLIIRGDYEDYVKSREIIEQLDIMQPQVAIELLIVNVNIENTKELGFQMRNKNDNTIGKGVNYQNSGLPLAVGTFAPIQVDQSNGSLMANLISLAANNTAGSSLISFGTGTNIWMMFKALQSVTDVTVVSNPFLTVANKFKAVTSLGEVRRVVVGTVTGFGTEQSEKDNEKAALEVEVEPQINADGIITMHISIKIDQFTNTTDFSSASKTTRHLNTTAVVANKETLALGGLVRDITTETSTRMPLLGNIPLIGNLFRNKTKVARRESLLIFISPEIVQPKITGGTGTYTQKKADYARAKINLMERPNERRDPIHRWFFKGPEAPTQSFDDFMARRAQAVAEESSITKYYINNTTPIEPRAATTGAPTSPEATSPTVSSRKEGINVVAPIVIPAPESNVPAKKQRSRTRRKQSKKKRSLASYLNKPQSGTESAT